MRVEKSDNQPVNYYFLFTCPVVTAMSAMILQAEKRKDSYLFFNNSCKHATGSLFGRSSYRNQVPAEWRKIKRVLFRDFFHKKTGAKAGSLNHLILGLWFFRFKFSGVFHRLLMLSKDNFTFWFSLDRICVVFERILVFDFSLD